jgi:hypothetical protein
MTDTASQFIEQWHRIVRSKDADAIAAILAPDVEVGGPAFWGKLRGKDTVAHFLGLGIRISAGLTFLREWVGPQGLAIEFKGKIGEQNFQGINLITLDDAARVKTLDILIRPIGAVAALRDLVTPQMTAYLLERGKGAS